jgi:hypothetical protein
MGKVKEYITAHIVGVPPPPKYPPEFRADTSDHQCLICKRLFGEHSDDELEACIKQLNTDLFTADRRCRHCGAQIRGHTGDELQTCFEARYKLLPWFKASAKLLAHEIPTQEKVPYQNLAWGNSPPHLPKLSSTMQRCTSKRET